MKVLVVGGAVSGKAAARLLRHLGHEVAVYDAKAGPLAELREEGYETHNGAWARRRLARTDLVVASPGVPPHAPPLADAAAADVEVWSEVELGYRHLAGVPVVGITGTNGKTTVTRLVADMLSASGLKAPAAGNIGDPLSGLALARLTRGETWDALAVELSSFQLHFTHTLRAQAAVVLNLAPDHLDWHGGFEAYRDAKARVLRNQGPGDLVVYDADDPGASQIAAGAAARAVPVSGSRRPAGGAGPENGKVWLGDDVAIDRDELPPVDAAYLLDLVAAGVAAIEVGATSAGVAATMRTFRPGPHRREVVAVRHGVTWVNDSKATNPHAAVAAASAYDSVVLIAGGRNKGLDLDALFDVPSIKHVVAIGEAAPDLAAAGSGRVSLADSIGEAVAEAAARARAGDTVLLSPACASFDMFRDYQQRGDAFTAAVRALGEEGS